MVHEWTLEDVRKYWVKRGETSHKGSNGKIGIIAGSNFMPGAAVFSSTASVSSGAGLTTLNTEKDVIPIVASSAAEVMYYLREDPLHDFIKDKDVIAVGPGLGQRTKTDEIIAELVTADQQMLIIDADGLYHIHELKNTLKTRKFPVVITPHPGEMAKILDSTPQEVNENRTRVAEHTAKIFNVYVVLKGPRTVIASPEGDVWVNTSGNAGLAKGGSGDVLTGMIAAFLGRYEKTMAGIATAVFLHGYTAEHLVTSGIAIDTITPTMLVEHFSSSFNEI